MEYNYEDAEKKKIHVTCIEKEDDYLGEKYTIVKLTENEKVIAFYDVSPNAKETYAIVEDEVPRIQKDMSVSELEAKLYTAFENLGILNGDQVFETDDKEAIYPLTKKEKFLSQLEDIATTYCYTNTGAINKQTTNRARRKIIKEVATPPEPFALYTLTVKKGLDGLIFPVYVSPEGRTIQYKK